MAELTANGVRFHVQRLAIKQADRRPGAPTVVFIHGLVMDNLSSFYYTLANPAAKAGANVILYDLRGHGLSERPRTGYSVRDSVADLDALLHALGVDEPVHLVGNSYGGTVALGFAVAHPERVASLVLIEAHFAVEGWGAQMADTLTGAGPRFQVAFGLDEDALETWRAQLGRKLSRMAEHGDALINGTTLVDDLLDVRPFPKNGLRSVTCPVLAVYGEDSDVLGHARALEPHLPRVTLEILPRGTHSLLTEATGRLRELLAEWLIPGGSKGADR